MDTTDRELWLLNFYRNSELHGALLMGRLARTLSDTALLVNVTKHCATEARHAAILSDAIAELGGTIDPHVTTVQERYSAKGGVPTALVDLLVLSEVLEHRVLDTYRSHACREDLHPVVQRTLQTILRDMEEKHDGQHVSWIEETLGRQPHEHVEAAKRKWREVDAAVVAELQAFVDGRFKA
jgi:bacterioferritin (cytochrome b1)